MSNKSALMMDYKSVFQNTISWIFGIAVLTVGVINIFWGNDLGFGVFLVLLSLVYFPPVNAMIRKRIGFSIPLVVKILLGAFIIWASMGVGELFNKIDLMMMDL
jgi:hypothetical protein